jgi:hypothetical protein
VALSSDLCCKKHNIFDDLPALTTPKTTDLHDELARYLNTDPEQVKDFFYGGMSTKPCTPASLVWHSIILQFQVRLSGLIPLLPLILIVDYETATSTDVECVFSQGRILLSHIRNRLSSQSTRALMCLGNWSRLGYVRDKDILAITVEPEVEGDEEELPQGWDAISDIA